MGVKEIMRCEEELPLVSLNHISFLCKSVRVSARFYEEVLGFVLIKRPPSLNFHGAWLFNYGVGIHLLEQNPAEGAAVPVKSRAINPKDNHISFQCTDIGVVKVKLEEMGMEYVSAVVEDGGIKVDQIFFHDPDGYMIEICNCENLPVLPISWCAFKPKQIACDKVVGCGLMESLMMASLKTDILNISF